MGGPGERKQRKTCNCKMGSNDACSPEGKHVGFLNGGKHTTDKQLSDSISSKSVWNSFSVVRQKCRQGLL